MASAQQILALVKSHAQGDNERFLTIAQQLANDAEKRGQGRVAAELRSMLAEARATGGVIQKTGGPIPLHRPRGDLAGLMSVALPERRLSGMVLDQALLSRLKKIVKEQRERVKLQERGLEPRRKFLLIGPPGTGKSMSANAIAAELGLPLFTVLLDGLITKYMGETAAKLRLVFEAMTERRGVYFFDEVDALATSRGVDNDVGEARRILNSFLQFLDDDRSTSIIFAATNHPELLDRAFFRRFQAAIEFGLPDRSLIRPLIENALAAFDCESLDWEVIGDKAFGLSHAEIALAADDAARDAVLERDGVMTTDLLVAALCENRRLGR